MIRYLFVMVPNLLFEPIAVGALLGILTALTLWRRKHDSFYGIVAVAIAFMLIWRLICHSLMASSRYSTMLLYPAVILTVWFCFQLENITQWIVAHFPRLNGPATAKLCAIVPALFIAGLFIASLIKTAYYNPYGKHTLKICETIRRETQGKKSFRLYSFPEQNRISFYTGIPLKNVLPLKNEASDSLLEALSKKLKHAENSNEKLYFVFPLRKGEPEPDADSLHIVPNRGKWECIHQEFTSRRKNKRVMLYRFTPLHPDIEEWSGQIPDLPKKNLLKNGGFEELLPENELKKRLEIYTKQGFNSYADPSRKMPADWGVQLGTDVKNPTDFRLTMENALAGVYSLSAVGKSEQIYFAFLCNLIKKQKDDLQFSFFVRNDDVSISKIRVLVAAWMKDKKKNYYVKDLTFWLDAGKTYRIHGNILKNDVPETADNFYFYVHPEGKYTFDQFSVTERKPNE